MTVIHFINACGVYNNQVNFKAGRPTFPELGEHISLEQLRTLPPRAFYGEYANNLPYRSYIATHVKCTYKDISNKNFNFNIDNKNIANFISRVKKFPKYASNLVEIFINSERDLSEIEPIAEVFSKYNKEKDILHKILLSNQNIKFNNSDSKMIITVIMNAIQEYQEYKQDIIDYACTQRYANSNYCNYITKDIINRYIDYLKKAEKTSNEHKQLVKELCLNRNVTMQDVNIYVNNFRPLNNNYFLYDCDKDVLRFYNKLNYSTKDICTIDNYIKEFPELKPLLLKEEPQYNLADKYYDAISDKDLKKRKQIKNAVEKEFVKETKILRSTMGEYYYPKIKWEQIVKDINDKKAIKENLDYINKISVFFTRIAVNEQKYGKNIKWAHNINNITEIVTRKIRNGEKFDLLKLCMGNLYGMPDRASSYSEHSNNNRKCASGEYRGFHDGGNLTPCNGYFEYRERFKQVVNKDRIKPYPDALLTIIKEIPVDKNGRIIISNNKFNNKTTGNTKYVYVMEHGYNNQVEASMKYVDNVYNKLLPYIKVGNYNKLSEEEKRIVNNYISEIYFLMANATPYLRGSNGICDIFMRALYRCLNVEMPALKNGCSLDIESFCMDLPEYQQKWKTFFVNDCKNVL